MIVSYGGYQLDDNSTGWVVTAPAKLDSNGVPYGYSPQYKLNIRVDVPDTGNQASDQAALTAKLAEVEAAFSQQFKDFIIYDNAGQPTVHKLINNQTLGGVKVLTRLEYPVSMGAEYSTYRNCTITLGADLPLNAQQGNNAIIDWQESVTYIGTGGPRYVPQEFVEERPVRQQVARYTVIRAIQSGSAMGFADYVPYPDPLFGEEYLDHPDVIRSPGTPQFMGNGVKRNYPTQWSYTFTLIEPQYLLPTDRPNG